MVEETLHTGFSIYQDIFSESECDRWLGSMTVAAFRGGRAGSRHLMSHPDVRRIASDSRMLRIARSALGVDAFPYRATLFEKSVNANWSVVWHQDTALPLQSRFDRSEWGPWSQKDGIVYAYAPAWALSRIVALRLHLDASTADNGPLRILPGTQALGLMADAQVFEMARTRPQVDCVVRRGGVMAMSPLLIHSSGKAKVVSSRRVLHIEYTDSLALAPGIELAIA